MQEDQIRKRLLGATIDNVIETCSRDGDVLILGLAEGDAVLIKADRLHLFHEPNFAVARGGVLGASVSPQDA